jgi:hypothetical protein
MVHDLYTEKNVIFSVYHIVLFRDYNFFRRVTLILLPGYMWFNFHEKIHTNRNASSGVTRIFPMGWLVMDFSCSNFDG